MLQTDACKYNGNIGIKMLNELYVLLHVKLDYTLDDNARKKMENIINDPT